MAKTKSNMLATHLTIVAIFLTLLWMFIADTDLLMIGNALALVYAVYAIGKKVLKTKVISKK